MEVLLHFAWDDSREQWLMRLVQKWAAGWLEPWQWESMIAAENNAKELREAAALHGRENTCEGDYYIVGYDKGRLVCVENF